MGSAIVRSGFQAYKLHIRSLLWIGLLCFIVPLLLSSGLGSGFLAVTNQQTALYEYQSAQAQLLTQSLALARTPSVEGSAALEALSAHVRELQAPLRGYLIVSFFLRFLVLLASVYGGLLLITCSLHTSTFRSFSALQKHARRFLPFIGLLIVLSVCAGLAFVPGFIAGALGAQFISPVVGGVLFLVFFIGGCYVALPLAVAPFLFVRAQLGVLASMRGAWKHVTGRRLYLFSMLFLLSLVSLIVSFPFAYFFPPLLLIVRAFVLTPLFIFLLARVIMGLR